MLGPTVGGGFAEWAGDQMAFAVLALGAALVVVVLIRYWRDERASVADPT